MAMKMQRIAGLLSLTILISILSACSGSNNQPGEATGSKEEVVKLTMIESLSSPKRTEVIKQLIAKFEAANANIKVELISPPLDSADNKITQMLGAKQAIDILEVRDITVKQFVTNGYLESLEPQVAGWSDYATVSASAKLMATDIDKTAYYIPYGIYQRQLFYRKDLFEAKGLEVPTTWEELYEAGKKLTDPTQNKYGYSFRGGAGGEQYITQIVQDYNGSNVNPSDSVFNNDGSNIFSTPGALQALNLYYNIYKDISPKDSASWGFSEQVQGFTSGTTAMLIQDPDTIDSVKTALDDSQWGTAPLPTGPDGIAHYVIGAAGWGMTSFSKHKEESWKLISFLSSPESNMEFAKVAGVIPIHTSASKDEFFTTGPYAPYIKMSSEPEKYIGVKPPTNYKGYSTYKQMGLEQGQSLLLGRIKSDELVTTFSKFWDKEKAEE